MAVASRAVQEEVVGANRDDVFFDREACQREKGQINGSNESRTTTANDASALEHHIVKCAQRVTLPCQVTLSLQMARMCRVQMTM